jgi:hypothetical protein
MRRTSLRILTLALVFLLLGVVVPSSALADDSSRVVLLLAPYTHWEDIDPDVTPFLYSQAEAGAVGDINVRNRGRVSGPPSATQGALTFGAGSWAGEDPLAPSAYDVGDRYEGGDAAEAFKRMTGAPVGDNEIVFLGMPRTVRLNKGAGTLVVSLGAVGQTILDAGGSTAAIGNSDSGYQVRDLWRSRPAALVAMDSVGRVPLGAVSTDLLENDPTAPYGFATDLEVLEEELERVSEALDDVDGPGLIVIDPGDSERAFEFAPNVSEAVAEVHHENAVRTLDAIARAAHEMLPEDGVLVVAPQVMGSEAGIASGLGPVIVSGPGWEGYLSSSSTQRQGLVTNLDVAATILDSLGLDVPVEVLGNPFVSQATSDSVDQRIARLQDMDDTAVAIDSAKPPIINTFIAFTTLTLVFATVVALRADRWRPTTVRRTVRVFHALLLSILTVPLASTLMFLFDPTPVTAGSAALWLGVTVGLLFLAALAVYGYTSSIRLPIGLLASLTTIVLVVDQWLGAPLSFTAFLGYSPLQGARYYGLGNEGAALLLGASLVGASMLLDEYRESRWAAWGRTWGLPILGLVVVVTSAAPFLGANVGVVAWGVAAYAVAWALMNGYKLSWKLVAVGLLVVIALVAAFSVADLLGGDESQTHLGRAWQSAGQGGLGELWLIVVRKVETNLRVLTHTNWAYVLIVVLAVLTFMRWRPQGDFADTLEENPYFSDAMAACLIGGFVAYFTEDSGIVIPAMIVLYVGVGVLGLMLARLCRPGGLCEDEREEAA